jgi:hypothetical protein
MAESIIDNDQGMKKILEEMKKLGKLTAKAGFPEGSGTVKREDGKEVDIADYASWNENGVLSSDNILKNGKLWRIPPRPFMAQAVDNNKSRLEQAGTAVVRQVANGKIDARAAVRRYAEGMIGLIKESIKNGGFKENSDITINGIMGKDGKWFIRPKKSTKPLVNSGMMRDSVMYQILEDGSVVAEGGKKPG